MERGGGVYGILPVGVGCGVGGLKVLIASDEVIVKLVVIGEISPAEV